MKQWWIWIFYGIGIVLFLLFALIAGLYRFRGTKLRTRMNYSLGMSLFFVLFFLEIALLEHAEGILVVTASIVGALLSIPVYFLCKKWIEKRLKGTTFWYERRQIIRPQKIFRWVVIIGFLWGIIMWLLIEIGVELPDLAFGIFAGPRLKTAILLIFGLCCSFSWLVANIFVLDYIVKLERKLGAPIMEDQR